MSTDAVDAFDAFEAFQANDDATEANEATEATNKATEATEAIEATEADDDVDRERRRRGALDVAQRWRRFTLEDEFSVQVPLMPDEYPVRCGKDAGSVTVETERSPVVWRVSRRDEGDAVMLFDFVEDELRRLCALPSPPRVAEDAAQLLIRASNTGRRWEKLCSMVFVKTGIDTYVTVNTLRRNLIRRARQVRPQQVQGPGRPDEGEEEAPPQAQVLPQAQVQVHRPQNQPELFVVSDDEDDATTSTTASLTPEEREMIQRLRSMRRHDTFMPPHPTEDFGLREEGGSEGSDSAIDCVICAETVPAGRLALRMRPPCLSSCVCRDCAGAMATIAERDAVVPACACPLDRRHIIPAARLARVLPAARFVALRTRMASLQQGRAPGWEATGTCMHPPCGRAGLPLHMNSPSYSCHVCFKAPPLGWCAFCGVEYTPGHRCASDADDASRISVAQVLCLIEEQRLPVVHPCPTCRQLTIKEDAAQCNHMTFAACRYEFCGVCGSPWNRGNPPHNTYTCYVARAFMRVASVWWAGTMDVLHNEFSKANVVAAYARVTGEPVPERFRPITDQIARELAARGPSAFPDTP
ncbi:MAG: hypothetical protein ABEI52_08405 [Halobacteriaceae archaeon]